ncbi:MAG: hypothetical protein KF850_20055 [Labilithrix sp.]|nr:hypothetical protein [Labilithrix sp.]
MAATSVTAPDAGGDNADADKKAAVATEGIEKELKERESKDRWQRLVVPPLEKCGSPHPVLIAKRSAVSDEAKKFAAATCTSSELNDDERAQCLQRCEAVALLARTEKDSSATTTQGPRASGSGDAEQRRRDAAAYMAHPHCTTGNSGTLCCAKKGGPQCIANLMATKIALRRAAELCNCEIR